MEPIEIIRFLLCYALVLFALHALFAHAKKRIEAPKKTVMGHLEKRSFVSTYDVDNSSWEFYMLTYSFVIDGRKHKKTFRVPRSVTPTDVATICYNKGARDAFLEMYPKTAPSPSVRIFCYIMLAPLLASLLSIIIGAVLGQL